MHHCIECQEVIEKDEERVLVFQEDENEYVVHDGECWDTYSQFI